MMTYHNDRQIKIDYDPTLNVSSVAENAIGATTSLTLRTLDFTPSDVNSVYVEKTGSDSTGDGTAANPFLTIKHAMTAVTATKCNIVIADSGTYVEESQAINTDCARIVAAIGQTPVIRPAAALVGAAADNYYCGEVVDTFLLEDVPNTQKCVSAGAHLSNGNTVIVYYNNTNVYGKILTKDGNEVIDDFEIWTGDTSTRIIRVCALANGHFVIISSITNMLPSIYVYTNAGVLHYTATLSAMSASMFSYDVCALAGYTDRFAVVSAAATDMGYLKFMILDHDGNVIKDAT